MPTWLDTIKKELDNMSLDELIEPDTEIGPWRSSCWRS